MKEGAAVAFGPRDEVLASLANPAQPPQLAAG
jgi:hypothetical protein